MILCNGFIPISLYITLEVIKVLQCILVLNADLKMYHRYGPQGVPQVWTSRRTTGVDISELSLDLDTGSILHIFSSVFFTNQPINLLTN